MDYTNILLLGFQVDTLLKSMKIAGGLQVHKKCLTIRIEHTQELQCRCAVQLVLCAGHFTLRLDLFGVLESESTITTSSVCCRVKNDCDGL